MNLISRSQDDRNNVTGRTYPTLDPFRVMDALLGWDRLSGESWTSQVSTFSPTFEVQEFKDAYVFKADLPGVAEEDVEVTVTGNALTVSGKRERELGPEGHRYHAMERGYGAFSRTFALPDGTNLDDLSANLRNGVLTLHVPKRPEVQPRKIQLGKGGSRA